MRGDDSLRSRLVPTPKTTGADVTSLIPDRYDLGERYSLGEILGEGGMGRVYAARDTFLGRDVVLKVPFKKKSDARHVIHEARASAKLESEHVARVLDAGKTKSGELPYIVMEKLSGEDLSHVVGKPIAVETAVDYLEQACEAIAEAHAMGIVHRDIKPSNLFLAEKRDGTCVIKVLDFGLADFGTAGKPREPDVVGTPHYMAPEVLLGETFDARSDVWSLGVVLFELLTGKPPFDADDTHAVWAQVLRADVPRADAIRTDVPEALADVVAKCLSRDAKHRYADGGALGRALAHLGKRKSPRAFIAAALSIALRANIAFKSR